MSQSLKWKRYFVPKTLFGRSLLIIILPVILIQVISTYIFFDSHWNRMTSRLSYAVSGEIALVLKALEQDDGLQNTEQKIVEFQKYLNLLVSIDKGMVLPQGSDIRRGWMLWEPMVHRTLRAELQKKIDKPFLINIDFQEKWVEVRIQVGTDIVNISMPQRRLFSSSSYAFLLWMFSISMVLVLISVVFMRNQIRPIRRLAIAADRFGKGRDVKDFKVEGAKEVRQAGQAFLDMKLRIQRQINQRMEMLAAVSHDLRTPMTRMKLQLAMMDNTSQDVLAVQHDLQDMEKMIAGYLNFVRGEGEEIAEVTDLVDLLHTEVLAIERSGVKVHFDPSMCAAIQMPLKPMAFRRCISNILTNASKYAPEIWLGMSQFEMERVDILIEDNGPGIPEDLHEAVFRPFYRVDSSRNAQTGGVGLGLAIAMDIVLGHGGKIWLDRSKHNGLAVHISLPL